MTTEKYDFPKKVGTIWQFAFELWFDGHGGCEIDINHDYQLDFSIVECVEHCASALRSDEGNPVLAGMSDSYSACDAATPMPAA
jgi:hypothetical protein